MLHALFSFVGWGAGGHALIWLPQCHRKVAKGPFSELFLGQVGVFFCVRHSHDATKPEMVASVLAMAKCHRQPGTPKKRGKALEEAVFDPCFFCFSFAGSLKPHLWASQGISHQFVASLRGSLCTADRFWMYGNSGRSARLAGLPGAVRGQRLGWSAGWTPQRVKVRNHETGVLREP